MNDDCEDYDDDDYEPSDRLYKEDPSDAAKRYRIDCDIAAADAADRLANLNQTTTTP